MTSIYQSHFFETPDDIASDEAITEAVKEIITNVQHRSRAMALRDRSAEIFVSHLQTVSGILLCRLEVLRKAVDTQQITWYRT